MVAERAGAAGDTPGAGFACFGLGAVISMAGSTVLPDCVAVGASTFGVGVSPAAGT